MKYIFDIVSRKSSKITTNTYSTSFSLGIRVFSKKFHDPIYGIYGYVRFADEIVDTFHDYDKQKLFSKFKRDTFEAIEDGISPKPASAWLLVSRQIGRRGREKTDLPAKDPLIPCDGA